MIIQFEGNSADSEPDIAALRKELDAAKETIRKKSDLIANMERSNVFAAASFAVSYICHALKIFCFDFIKLFVHYI
jgi:hypothetical protein